MTVNPSPDDLLAIGEIVRPRGIRGELKVRLLCNDFDHFRQCLGAGEIFLWNQRPGLATPAPPPGRRQTPASPGPARVVSARPHGGFALVTLNGVATIDDAERLRGWLLGLRVAQAPPPGEDTFYHFQLEGLAIVDENGEKIGAVQEMRETLAHDHLLVRPLNPRLRPFLIPLVATFVKRIDLKSAQIDVALPPGLIESQQ